MKFFWLAFLIVPILAAAIILLYALWKSLTNISDVMADIRHGKGIFLTFKYAPEEWEYYTQTLPFIGINGKACFTRNHIYLSDGTEEILYEISGDVPTSARLRKVCIEEDFIVFTVRTKELIVHENSEIKPDCPDYLWQYKVFIPESQRTKTDELMGFYRKVIDKTNEQYY
jgi:hypothetical protein